MIEKKGQKVTLPLLVKNGITFLHIVGKTMQAGSGEPSPDNIRAITGASPAATIEDSTGTHKYAADTAPLYDGDYVNIISGAVHRKQGVYVFTGTENFIKTEKTGFWNFSATTKLCTDAAGGGGTKCSHYVYSTAWPGYKINVYAGGYVDIQDQNCASVDDFKAYLAAQYAAGTPVTVVYELATETNTKVTPQAIENAAADTLTVTVESTATVQAETMQGQQDVFLLWLDNYMPPNITKFDVKFDDVEGTESETEAGTIMREIVREEAPTISAEVTCVDQQTAADVMTALRKNSIAVTYFCDGKRECEMYCASKTMTMTSAMTLNGEQVRYFTISFNLNHY